VVQASEGKPAPGVSVKVPGGLRCRSLKVTPGRTPVMVMCRGRSCRYHISERPLPDGEMLRARLRKGNCTRWTVDSVLPVKRRGLSATEVKRDKRMSAFEVGARRGPSVAVAVVTGKGEGRLDRLSRRWSGVTTGKLRRGQSVNAGLRVPVV